MHFVQLHIFLQELQNALCPSYTGDVFLESPQLVDLSLSLLTFTVPMPWLTLVGPSAPPKSWSLREWLQDLVLRFSFFDRVLIGGLTKTATYWLGAFFNPAAFLNIIQQVAFTHLQLHHSSLCIFHTLRTLCACPAPSKVL